MIKRFKNSIIYTQYWKQVKRMADSVDTVAVIKCNEKDNCMYEPGDQITTSWTDLFKDEESSKAIYVDDEAYYIDIIEE